MAEEIKPPTTGDPARCAAPSGSVRPAHWTITRERCEAIINDIAEGIEPRTNQSKLYAVIAMLADDRMEAWETFNGLREKVAILMAESLAVKHPSQNAQK